MYNKYITYYSYRMILKTDHGVSTESTMERTAVIPKYPTTEDQLTTTSSVIVNVMVDSSQALT